MKPTKTFRDDMERACVRPKYEVKTTDNQIGPFTHLSEALEYAQCYLMGSRSENKAVVQDYSSKQYYTCRLDGRGNCRTFIVKN